MGINMTYHPEYRFQLDQNCVRIYLRNGYEVGYVDLPREGFFRAAS
jgi:hypothetical protein